MKTISKVLFALLFVGTFSLTAYAKDVGPKETLKKEIARLMSGVELPDGGDFSADVKFLVNEDNQIVVVAIDTDDKYVESLIKHRLNYRKVKSDEAKVNKINQIKFTLKQPK